MRTQAVLLAGATQSLAPLRYHRVMRMHLVGVSNHGEHGAAQLRTANSASEHSRTPACSELLPMRLAGRRRGGQIIPPAVASTRAAITLLSQVSHALALNLFASP